MIIIETTIFNLQEERIIHTVLDNYEVEIINGSQSNLAQRLLQLFAAAKLAQSDIQETEDDSKRTKKVNILILVSYNLFK